MHQARGCQVLLVDAEGSDCAILRSMMHTCKRGEMPWPWVIHFETCGHCDTKEHDKVEEQTVMDLQKEGYLLVYAGRDSTLLHEPALRAERGLPLWADEHFTLRCDACGWLAWPSHPGFKEQAGTGFGHWQGSEQCSRRWRCNWCCKWLPEPSSAPSSSSPPSPSPSPSVPVRFSGSSLSSSLIHQYKFCITV